MAIVRVDLLRVYSTIKPTIPSSRLESSFTLFEMWPELKGSRTQACRSICNR